MLEKRYLSDVVAKTYDKEDSPLTWPSVFLVTCSSNVWTLRKTYFRNVSAFRLANVQAYMEENEITEQINKQKNHQLWIKDQFLIRNIDIWNMKMRPWEMLPSVPTVC